ncbi:MAG: hypothetical protein QW667_03685 [Candidatus Bathyarchaeia archaeon]
MKKWKAIFCLSALIAAINLGLTSMCTKVWGVEEPIWYIYDVIDASLEHVKWTEEGATSQTPEWISIGLGHSAWMYQSLVGESDIFVETYELLNWSRIKEYVSYYYNTQFNTFYDFAAFVEESPNRWLELSWQIDTQWYGVDPNMSKLKYSYNETTADAEIWTWFHITRIPEYFAGEGMLENWLTGFDLTQISTCSLERWELRREWSLNGVWYKLQFKAPASILTQHLQNYTFTINMLSNQLKTNKVQQVIEINMPLNTEVKEATPADLCIIKGNTATFTIGTEEKYPNALKVISGPPAKSLSQMLWEGASLWLFTPAGWGVMASLTVLTFTGLRGRKILGRNRVYSRLYKNIVTLYDLHAHDNLRFRQEMDNMNKSIITMFLQDRITDQQFERLLQRLDDFRKRAQG